MGLLSPYGLMSNLAVVVFIGCSCLCFFGPLIQVGRGRHSGILMSVVSKPLRAYVEPSKVCLNGLFLI